MGQESNECVQESACTAVRVNSPPSFPVWCRSLLCQLLSTEEGKAMYQRLCNRVTARGVRIQDCIVGGVTVPQHPVGILAGDSECYIVFSELFEPVLRALQPAYNFDIGGLLFFPCWFHRINSATNRSHLSSFHSLSSPLRLHIFLCR